MKRLVLRLSALSAVVVLGLIAIAQAQRGGTATAQGDDPASSAPQDPFALPRGGSMNSDGSAAPREPGRFVPDSSVKVLSVEEHRIATPDNPIRPASGTADLQPAQPTPAAPVFSGAPAGAGDSIYSSGGKRSAPAAAGPAPDGAPAVSPFDGRDAKPLNPSSQYAPGDSSPVTAATTLPAAPPTFGPDHPSNRVEIHGDESADNQSNADSQPASVMRHGGTPFNSLRAAPAAARPAPEIRPAAAEIVRDDPPTASAEGTGHPGGKQLEGAQSPHLTIEKVAPAEVQVGKPAKFEIHVRNSGEVAAQGVEIHDEIPKGTQLVATTPNATQGPRGELVWSFGTLQPGEQAVAQLDLLPIAEGEIGSVASVSFRADASVRTVATKPDLTIQLAAPKQAMIGDEVKLAIRVSNPGSGTATGVVLTEHVPAGLKHAAGKELEFEVGTLKPGESRQIELALTAAAAGRMTNVLSARGDANLRAEDRAELTVVAPGLSVAMTGPTRRYLERQATYTVSVSNPGTAPAKDVELITQLPKGLKFVKANNAGHFDPQTNSVVWSLAELPASETGSVTLVAMPVEMGEQRLKVQGKAQQGLADEKEQTVVVEGLASIAFDVQAGDEAIEVGGETTYLIHVVNQGSKAAANIQIAALLPPELKALKADGPSREQLDDHHVQFEPLPRLAPKAEATYHIRAQALQPGDLRLKVQLMTDDLRQPVTKEESTRVYADQ